MLHNDFREFLELLIKHQVEYLIVGGYAVGAYGHPRYTGDLDIWINRTPSNASKVLSCLHEYGFKSANLEVTDLVKAEQVIQLGYPPLRIDLLTDIEGVTFENAYQRKMHFDLEGLNIDFISFNDLIKNKESTGRPIDLDDIENLKK